MVHPTFNFFNQISRYFKCQFFKRCLVERLLSTQNWISIFSLNSLKNTLLQRASISNFSISSKNEISETHFQRFFDFHGGLPMQILPKKKSGYMAWYLFFLVISGFFFLSNQFAPCNRPKKSPDITKKVQISP